jgi:hypothetical protein
MNNARHLENSSAPSRCEAAHNEVRMCTRKAIPVQLPVVFEAQARCMVGTWHDRLGGMCVPHATARTARRLRFVLFLLEWTWLMLCLWPWSILNLGVLGILFLGSIIVLHTRTAALEGNLRLMKTHLSRLDLADQEPCL